MSGDDEKPMSNWQSAARDRAAFHPPTLDEQIAAATSDPNLSPESVAAIEVMFRETYAALVAADRCPCPDPLRAVDPTCPTHGLDAAIRPRSTP